ncbi:PAC2 family protein [Herbiconiux moechotypicola]|uniref:Filament polymerization regulator ParJ n=1 Tax=Herbiconiux moechotypicola TaxID=637393 RepID=A0ABN3E0Y2_9MICO|nr:PAC2 family protein [Herbiconiux moechotypicola]MCS5731291.1 PAC2 family protein [Herbiconiux moechotypicola]
MTDNGFQRGRLLLVAFEGWNDAGEAATGALRVLKDQLDVIGIAEVDSERYYDYQFNRPNVVVDDDGKRVLEWPGTSVYGPSDSTQSDAGASRVYLLIGTEPSRNWRSFTAEVMATVLAEEITGVVLLGAMLADVPHTRPISVFASSENAVVRSELDVERSTYEGPVGILSVLAEAAEAAGIPTVSVWASVPHYVHNAPSPKATLALVEKIEELVRFEVDRGELADESAAWEAGIDALAGDDDDMAAYIQQLEQARDTVDSPEASGEAIAQEFERYLRKRGDGRAGGDGRPDEPWRRD